MLKSSVFPVENVFPVHRRGHQKTDINQQIFWRGLLEAGKIPIMDTVGHITLAVVMYCIFSLFYVVRCVNLPLMLYVNIACLCKVLLCQ